MAHGRPQVGSALDELSCAGQNFVAGFGALASIPKTLSPADVGLSACEFSDLNGGDVAENLATMHALLSGAADAVPTGLRDSVLFNAGVALWIAGAASDAAAGVAKARETLQSGAVEQWLQRVREFYKKG